MTPEEKIKKLKEKILELESQIRLKTKTCKQLRQNLIESLRKIEENNYLKKKEKIYDIILEENIVLDKFLHDIFRYADLDIRERHGDEEYIVEDLKNMFFKVQSETRKIRAKALIKE